MDNTNGNAMEKHMGKALKAYWKRMEKQHRKIMDKYRKIMVTIDDIDKSGTKCQREHHWNKKGQG